MPFANVNIKLAVSSSAGYQSINFDGKTGWQQVKVPLAFVKANLDLGVWCEEIGLPLDSNGVPVHQIRQQDGVSVLRSLASATNGEI